MPLDYVPVTRRGLGVDRRSAWRPRCSNLWLKFRSRSRIIRRGALGNKHRRRALAPYIEVSSFEPPGALSSVYVSRINAV